MTEVHRPKPHAAPTGKLIFVMGVKGCVGATAIATWAARHLAETLHRRVLLLDLALSAGDAALQFDVREALDKPARVDSLFLERAMIHVPPQLDLLASAALLLLTNLLHRYRYVFVDVPQALAPQLTHVLHLPSTLLLISDGSLVSARDVVRWREKLGADTAERQTLHILNNEPEGGDAGLARALAPVLKHIAGETVEA